MTPDEVEGLNKFTQVVKNKINERQQNYGVFSDWPIENIRYHLTKEVGELFVSDFSADESIDVAACAFMNWFKQQPDWK